MELPAIILECGGKIAGHAPVEDALCVQYTERFEVQRHPDAREFFHEQRDVEREDVVSAKIAILQHLHHFAGDVLERRRVLHVIICDAVNGGRFRRDGDTGVHAEEVLLFPAAGMNLQDGEVNNAIHAPVGAGGFDVENRQGAVQFQVEHRCLPLQRLFRARTPLESSHFCGLVLILTVTTRPSRFTPLSR